jgi:carboxyl-terminal processing protease
MKRIALWVITIIVISSQYCAVAQSDTTLQAKPAFGKQAKIITYLLENNHYRKLKLNDSLSSVILDAYLLNLDNSKLYFLASDIVSFEKYRDQIDNLTRVEDTTPAFEIYRVFKKRFDERMGYVQNHLINTTFDFTTNELYESERDKQPWAKSNQELDELWTKIIKNQALSLKLAGKQAEEIQSTIKSRYDRFIKSMKQTNSEDVFSIYMNAITEAYDPHTNYFSPSDQDRFNVDMSQSLEGIGARLQADNDYTKVSEIIPGGPADKSKLIHPNDRIIAVAQGETGEWVDVVGWRLDDVVKLIKGPKGTQVRLQILPAETGVNGPPVTISLVRDKIKLEDQTAKKKVYETMHHGRNLKLGVIILPKFYMDFEAYQKGDPNYNSTTRDVKKTCY